MHRTPRFLSAAALLVLASATACGDDEKTPDESGVPAVTGDMLANYAAIVSASYEDSVALAEDLDTAIEAFVADPTDDNLAAARQAWRDSREPYLQTEVYRFYNGPIDNEQDGPEGLLNAWPLDEAWIDYTVDDPTSGIVNDATITIDAAQLEQLNEQGGEENVATGYHAIEFLLWGQDTNPDSAGDRPAADYVLGDDGNPNADRRATYLTTASDLMLTHLAQVRDAWAPGVAGNYRAEWDGLAPEEGLARVMTGMIILAGFETGGERLQTALDSGDQEDEHSCFSDNTHRDMVQDVRGIQNVWLGSYERVDGTTISGPGVRDVLTAVNTDLATQITEQIAQSLALAEALQPPFDNEIALDNAEGRDRVLDLITSLRDLEGLLQDAFREFDLAIPSAE